MSRTYQDILNEYYEPKKSSTLKHVGFWKKVSVESSESCGQFNVLFSKNAFDKYPVENSNTHNNTSSIEKLKKIEQASSAVYYYGCSTCRICGEDNGCGEYTYNDFVWPEGYMHYLEEHNVKMDEEFEEFLLNLEI